MMVCKTECNKCLRYLAETEAHLVNIASAFEADGMHRKAAMAASKALDDLALKPVHGTDDEWCSYFIAVVIGGIYE